MAMTEPKPFRTIVAEFTKFMEELYAVGRHDPILRDRLQGIARTILRESDGQLPYENDQRRSAAIMAEFTLHASRCIEERMKELENAHRRSA